MRLLLHAQGIIHRRNLKSVHVANLQKQLTLAVTFITKL